MDVNLDGPAFPPCSTGKAGPIRNSSYPGFVVRPLGRIGTPILTGLGFGVGIGIGIGLVIDVGICIVTGCVPLPKRAHPGKGLENGRHV